MVFLHTQVAAFEALCVQYEPDFRPNMRIVAKALQQFTIQNQQAQSLEVCKQISRSHVNAYSTIEELTAKLTETTAATTYTMGEQRKTVSSEDERLKKELEKQAISYGLKESMGESQHIEVRLCEVIGGMCPH